LVGSVKRPQFFGVENKVARLRSVVIGEEAGRVLAVLGGL